MNISTKLNLIFFFISFFGSFNNTFGESKTIPKSFIKKFLPSNPIVVEAGAHNGNDTLQMANLWPNGFIYAFEPVPNLYRILSNQCQGKKNIKSYPLALSSTLGKSSFYISSGYSDGSSSLLKPTKDLETNYPTVLFNEVITVDTITLDHWAEQNKIDHIDFLWLDLQGSEPEVLMASPKILKTVKVIYTEVNYIELYEGCILYPSLKEFLMSEGFNEIYEGYPYDAQGNVLFVRNDQIKIEQYN